MKKWLKDSWNKLSITVGVFVVVINILDLTHIFSPAPPYPISVPQQVAYYL